MRKQGIAAELEIRPRLAGQLLLEGRKTGEVMEVVGASQSSVKRWKRALREGGMEALKAKPHPGPKPRLNATQKRRLLKLLVTGPPKAGYHNELWTCSRVAVENATIRRPAGPSPETAPVRPAGPGNGEPADLRGVPVSNTRTARTTGGR